MISGTAFRRQHADFAAFPVYGYMHKNIEADRDFIGENAIRLQRFTQVSEASSVRMGIAINDTESICAAGSEQKIMTADSIFHNLKHNIASVRVKWVSFGQKDSFRIINGPSGRKVFFGIVLVKTDEIGDLFSLDIGNGKSFSFLEDKSSAAAWGYGVHIYRLLKVKGHFQLLSYCMPLY